MTARSSSKPGAVGVEPASGEARLQPIELGELRLRHVLVPVDFSDSSRKALQYAESLARQFHAEIQLLHVAEIVPPPPDLMIVADTEALSAENREVGAKRLAEWQQALGSRVNINSAARLGNPKHEIIQTAQETNTDLIVMGTRGRSGLSRLLTGSTTEHVVRHAPCPVLVVREREHDFLVPAVPAEGATTAATV
jgi:nucleotide-binding universal stress UspA family protein